MISCLDKRVHYRLNNTLIYLDEYNQIEMLTDDYIIPEDEELKRIEFSMTYLDNYLDEWYNKKKISCK